MASFEPVAPAPEDADGGYEPTAMDIFWKKVEDWFCVRGDFTPKGVTREFAVATRWLTRVGALLLVGAVAYFLVLAIDKGWIGPVQRVFGMMFWGIIGSVFGTWLKLKSERYAILGEVCAAVGLVAVYLSFGLGHRYFSPPVISSGYVAFAGLFVATAAAGYLSVRLRSLMIAGLALVGGFLVPTICSFTSHDVQLHVTCCRCCAVTHRILIHFASDTSKSSTEEKISCILHSLDDLRVRGDCRVCDLLRREMLSVQLLRRAGGVCVSCA